MNYGERRDDVFAVGAAILDGDHEPIAGLGVSVPAHRFSEEVKDHRAERLVIAAQNIGRRPGR